VTDEHNFDKWHNANISILFQRLQRVKVKLLHYILNIQPEVTLAAKLKVKVQKSFLWIYNQRKLSAQ